MSSCTLHNPRPGHHTLFHRLRNSLPTAIDEPRQTLSNTRWTCWPIFTGRKDSIGVDAIIQTVLDATGYEAVLLASPTGKRMLGNVRLLLEQARSATTGALSLSQFIAQMTRW